MLTKMRDLLVAAAVLLAAGLSAEVVNGDFTQAGADGTPEGWQCVRHNKKADGIAVDREVCRSANGALRLRNGNEVTQDIKLKPNTEYRFSCWYKTSQCDQAPGWNAARWGGGCDLALRSVLPDGKTHWHFGTGRKYRGTMDWTRVEFKFNSSRLKSDTLRIIFSVTGTVPDGACWFDDVKLEELETPQAAQKAAPAPAPQAAASTAAAPQVFEAVVNGDFSKAGADGAPEGWQWVRRSKKADGIAVDREVCRSANGALRLRSGNEVTQDIKLKPNTEYRFSCWYKTSQCDPDPNRDVKRWGGGCDLALRSVLPDGKTHWHFGIGRKYRGTADWTRVEFKFNSSRLKSDTLRIILSMEGTVPQGACWFDDIVLEEVGGEKTTGRVLPVDYQKGIFHIAENLPGQLRMDFTGDAGKLLKAGVTLRMELPKEFRVIGAVADRWNTRLPETDPNFMESSPAKEVTAPGAPVRTFELAVPNQMLRNLLKSSYNWGNCLYIAVAAEPGSRGKSGKALLTLHSAGKEIYRYPFVLCAFDPVKLPERPCTMLVGGVSRPSSQYGHFPEVNEAYRKFWASLTEQRVCGSRFINFYRTFRPKFYGETFFEWQDFGSLNGLPLPVALQLGRKKLAELPPLIDRDGRPVKGRLATWYVADDPDHLIWPAMREVLRKALDEGGERVIRIDNNFETNVDVGYDEENIRRFAQFAKLKKIPTRQEVRTAYSELWKEYQLQVNARIVRQYAKVVHENFPGKLFVSCNTLLKKGEKFPVDVDRRMFDDVVDVHMPMCYMSGVLFFDRVGYNLSIPGKPFHVLVDPTENYELYYHRYTPLETGRDIVAATALGAYGFRFYPQDNFDARYLQYIADAYDTVRKLEKFYAARKPCTGAELVPENVVTTRFTDDGREVSISYPEAGEFVRHTLHEAADGEKLLTVFNYSDKHNMIFRLTIPGGGKVYDPIHSRNYPDGDWQKGALVEVPAQGTGYFVITKRTPPALKNSVDQSVLRKRLDEDKQHLASANRFIGKRQGNAEIGFARLPDTGAAPMMKLQSEHYRIYIDCMNGADVVSWKQHGNAQDDILFAANNRGFLGRPIWQDKTQDRQPPYAFRMLDNGFEADGSPWAEFAYTVPQYDNVETALNPLMGLETVKRITLRDGGKRVVIRFTFTNKNELKQTIPLAFRINNAPIPGNRFLGGGRAAGRITEIGYSSPAGAAKLTASDSGSRETAGSTSTHLVRVPRTDRQKHPAEREWHYSPITVTAAADGMTEALTVVPPDQGIAGVYCWRGTTLCTVEPYSETIPLKPGESKVFTLEYLR